MKSLACCLLLVGCFGSCSALDCYQCIGCGDPFDSSAATTTTCPAGQICQVQQLSSGATSGVFARGCAEPAACSPGCISSPSFGTVCSYCCDQDLCNSESIADAIEDILHCYSCTYSSDASAANFSSAACDEPFDPRGAGVLQSPCVGDGGQCGVITTRYSGQRTVNRLCISNSTFPGGCVPGCGALNITCKTCCSDNLCNGGGGRDGGAPPTAGEPSAAPPTAGQPSAAPPTTAGGEASFADLCLVVAAPLLVAIFGNF